MWVFFIHCHVLREPSQSSWNLKNLNYLDMFSALFHSSVLELELPQRRTFKPCLRTSLGLESRRIACSLSYWSFCWGGGRHGGLHMACRWGLPRFSTVEEPSVSLSCPSSNTVFSIHPDSPIPNNLTQIHQSLTFGHACSLCLCLSPPTYVFLPWLILQFLANMVTLYP